MRPNPEDKVLKHRLIQELNLGLSIPSSVEFHGVASTSGQFAASRPPPSLPIVLDCLRQAAPHRHGPLASLDVRWKSAGTHKLGLRCTWSTLLQLTQQASEEEALYLVQALVRATALSGSDGMKSRQEIAKRILSSAGWRNKAIAAHPELFVPKNRFGLPRTWAIGPNVLWRDNPFVLLTSLERPDADEASTRSSLFVLDAIGAISPKRSSESQTVLHQAAARLSAGPALAYAKHFAPLLRAQDRQGQTPLHVAAVRGDASVIAALMAGGAPCDVLTLMGDSPLDESVKSKSLEAVKALCECAWRPTQNQAGRSAGGMGLDRFTLKRARSWAIPVEIKSYLDAVIARHAIEAAMSIAARSKNGTALV